MTKRQNKRKKRKKEEKEILVNCFIFSDQNPSTYFYLPKENKKLHKI